MAAVMAVSVTSSAQSTPKPYAPSSGSASTYCAPRLRRWGGTKPDALVVARVVRYHPCSPLSRMAEPPRGFSGGAVCALWCARDPHKAPHHRLATGLSLARLGRRVAATRRHALLW